MKYLSILLIIFVLSCSKSEKCSPIFTDLNGNIVFQCCDDGIFRESAICKCIKNYNKVNNTNYKWIGHCGN